MIPTVEFSRILPESVAEARILFRNVFSQSESEEEGVLVERVVHELTDELDKEAVVGFGAWVSGGLIGAIFFSRMTFEHGLQAFLLAPVGVETNHQGRGIGQALIQHGLNKMKRSGVQFVATYGDPSFYSRVGFESLPEQLVQPPFVLSQPEGWLGQSLEGRDMKTYSGRFTCVQAFNNASLW